MISLNSFAQDSTYLNVGDKATFSGYLLPESTVKNLRNDSLELSMYQRIDPLKDQQIQLLTDQNNKLATTLQSTSSLSTWEKIGWFAGGILVTGLAVEGASKLAR